MKKRILTIIVVAMMMLSLVGCDEKRMIKETDLQTQTDSSYSMFVEVEDGESYKVVYHKDTKVMYVMSYGYDTYGIFTLMVNPDGTPMLYEK